MPIAGRYIGGQYDLVEVVDDIAIVLLGLSMKVVHRSRQDNCLCTSAWFFGIELITRKNSKHAVIAAIVDGLHHCASIAAPLAGEVEKLLKAIEVHQTSDVIEQHEREPNNGFL